MIGDSSLGAREKRERPVRSVVERASGEVREACAEPPPAPHNLQATRAALTPLLDGSVPRIQLVSMAAAFLLGAIARDTLGELGATWRVLERAPERALDFAEPGEPTRPRERLTQAEARVLPYLPTNLSAREIAEEMYLSTNTVKTHLRHLYQKLGAHNRTQAVELSRARGLLAPTSRRP
jgi:LuxR family transcriptional regulator, maltose regulon positive regulatory protein